MKLSMAHSPESPECGNHWKPMETHGNIQETSNYEATICGWFIYHFLPTISGDFGGHLELRTGAVPITVDSLHHWWLPGNTGNAKGHNRKCHAQGEQVTKKTHGKFRMGALKS